MNREAIKNRYEILGLIDARMCNQNGDPAMANMPRQDLETGQGIISSVAIKSRIRDYVKTVVDMDEKTENNDILIQHGSNLNRAIAEAVLDVNGGKIKEDKNTKVEEAADYIRDHYWDARAFGAVLSTGLNAGQINGTVQVYPTLSVDPIDIEIQTITRKCYADKKDKYKTIEEYDKADEKKDEDTKRTMGTKPYSPYGLYPLKISISACEAERNGFTEDDLKLLFEAIVNMYNYRMSDSKAGMNVISPVLVFKHIGFQSGSEEQDTRSAKLGCASAQQIFDLLDITKKDGVEYPRAYTDYDITYDFSKLPRGVQSMVLRDAYSNPVPIATKEKVSLDSLA